MKNLAKIIALLLVACTVLSLCACGGNGNDEETKAPESSQKETADEANDSEDDKDSEEETTEGETTEEDTTAEDTTVEDTTAAQTQAQTQPPQTQAPQTQAQTNPNGAEILGKGSKNDPYLEIPVVGTSSMSVTTVAVPAGKTLFYGIQRIGGMLVTINNANAYVICNGVRYDAKNGAVSFIAPAALASDYITLEIGNKGGSAASFTIIFTNLVGTQANPAIISSVSVNSQNKITLSEGDSDGYNYKYKAEKTGKIRFYMTATVTSILSVTNNRNSAQRTTEADAQTDAQGTYVELDVNAGDELIIVVGAKPNVRGKYPATTITWYAKYI